MSQESLHDLLPLYLGGKLSPEDADRFREHLESCEICRNEIALLESVKKGAERHGDAFFEDHPTVERMVAGVRGELDGDDRARFESHLEICPTCAREADWIRADAAANGAADPVRFPVPRRAPSFTRWAGWAVAAAASVALLFTLGRPTVEPPGAGRLETVFLRPAERTEQVGASVRLGSGESRFAVAIEVDLVRSDFPARVEVEGRNGTLVHVGIVDDRSSLLDELYYVFGCDLQLCPPGRYTVRVTAVSDSADPIEQFLEVIAVE